MTKRVGRRHFTVDVVGHRLNRSVWRIDGALRFADGLDVAARDNLLGNGRLALIDAIVREGIRGRSRGATAVQVHMDIDGRIFNFELADIPIGAALPL